jgi:hypothetical protein
VSVLHGSDFHWKFRVVECLHGAECFKHLLLGVNLLWKVHTVSPALLSSTLLVFVLLVFFKSEKRAYLVVFNHKALPNSCHSGDLSPQLPPHGCRCLTPIQRRVQPPGAHREAGACP